MLHNGSTSSARTYPYNLEVKLEAVDRIQTQVNLNRASMEGFSRELQRNVAEIHAIKLTHNSFVDQTEHYTQVINELRNELVAMKQEVINLRANAAKAIPPPAAAPLGERVDDQTLEILTTNLATVSAKANEVDNLRLGYELMKRRLARLEEQVAVPNTTPSKEPPSHSKVSHTPIQPPPPQASSPTIARSPHQERRVSSIHYSVPQHPGESGPPRHAPIDVEHQASAWASVNKRPHTNGVEVPHPQMDLSPSKRQRLLAPSEPRRASESTRYDPTRHEGNREPPAAYYQTESNESYPESAEAAAYHAAAYPEREAIHEAERQRTASISYGAPSGAAAPHHTSPGSRGRGRGGRPRKYMPTYRTAWQSEKAAIIDGQVVQRGPDGQWYAMGPADSSRRSSIAGVVPTIPMSPATQAAVLNQQESGEYSPGMQSSMSRDPYAHTKKTRTKPIRNSEGVLIRKDGRPDMRSHSSAANLRKVHAKKEQERRMEAGGHEGLHSHQGSVFETRDNSTSSTPGPMSSHRPSDAGHFDDQYEHDEREMKREDGEVQSMYPGDVEEGYHTPGEEEHESMTTPESVRGGEVQRSLPEPPFKQVYEEHREELRKDSALDELPPREGVKGEQISQ